MGTFILTFDTTHHALWAEQVARELGLGVEVIPAPVEAGAKCDLALEVLAEDEGVLIQALREREIVFRRFPEW